jgi:S-adenosylmethionine synthetase
MKSYFTSESVTPGHPDKVADQISDAVLDAMLKEDPYSRSAAETTVEKGLCRVFGEVTTKAKIDYEKVIRDKIAEIGYTDDSLGFSDKSRIEVALHTQSPDIALGVDRDGAGDQGMMFGYASSETENLMPLALTLSRSLVVALTDYRKSGNGDYLRPDGKSQVTVLYENGRAKCIDTVVLSAQHSEEISTDDLRNDLKKNVILRTLPENLITPETKYYINPTGRFVLGGPAADTGLTGRKIIADTYGGYAHHGGGAFSGKDGTKVDRSASYKARQIAKTLVASGLFTEAEIQLSYAIGVAEPVSIHVEAKGKSVDEEKLVQFIRDNFALTPKGIIDSLSLRTPVFADTARFGHFGFPAFSWEKVDESIVEDLRRKF